MIFAMAIDPWDSAVLVVYLLAVVGFGIWMGRGQRTMTGYLLGGRDLPWWAILGSIVATFSCYLESPNVYCDVLDQHEQRSPESHRFLECALSVGQQLSL